MKCIAVNSVCCWHFKRIPRNWKTFDVKKWGCIFLNVWKKRNLHYFQEAKNTLSYFWFMLHNFFLTSISSTESLTCSHLETFDQTSFKKRSLQTQKPWTLSKYELLQRYYSKLFLDFRSSRSITMVFYNNDVLNNCDKFTEKHLCQILFRESQACIFFKKDARAQGFSCKFFAIFTNIFFTEHLWAAFVG